MRRCSGTFDKAGSDAGLPCSRDAGHSREGRKPSYAPNFADSGGATKGARGGRGEGNF